jgi:hypothetical protein
MTMKWIKRLFNKECHEEELEQEAAAVNTVVNETHLLLDDFVAKARARKDH